MGYTEVANLQQQTLGSKPLTPELARQLAAYWAREVARMDALPLIESRHAKDPLWPQELKRAQTLAATLATQQVTQYTDAQVRDIFGAVKRFALEMDRWLNSSTMKANYPDFSPSGFKWPGGPIVGPGTEIQGSAGGGALMLLALLWALSE
jgi:hypothetical protein